MPQKILALAVVIFSLFTLSACDRLDQAGDQLLDQLDSTPSPIPTITDETLLQELDTGTEFSIDADLSNLEKELQQL